ncbi:MAG TPA: radical SAM family heme chaperone HemW [Aeromicrobium sp.]|nr:radical SAM family heme chaperone HemW [Aeromicrobium sp.]
MAFGIYLHVPFCSVRCGYCDFNTYTADDLGGPSVSGASRDTYIDSALAELELVPNREVDTVFVGGGTPTQLRAGDLVRFLTQVDERLGLAPNAEVTTEANPDSVSRESLKELRDGGFNRISFGMQSAVPHVLRVLDRTHDPERVPQAVAWAREAGFEQISVDLIYGSPGESVADWRTTVEAALAMEPDHVSAYALIVEDGTAFARKVRRGEVVMPDDDETADKYLLADELLSAAGLNWYELSNWSKDEASACQHNLGYWNGGQWWGIGPGAHSFVDGERWWNVKHPAAYAGRLSAAESPRADGERPDEAARRLEDVMLRIRLAEGIEPGLLKNVDEVIAAGWLERHTDRLVLTRSGRLMADHVVRRVT